MIYVVAVALILLGIGVYRFLFIPPKSIETVETPDLINMTPEQKRDHRKKERERRKKERREWRIQRINAIKEKIYAVASKRKWLFFIIAGAIIAYLVIFKGVGGGTTDGLLEKIKGLF